MDDTPQISEYNVQYPKPSYGRDFHLAILDDLEVAIRTTIAVVALGSICLYEEEQTVIDEYPLCFLMMVVAVALSLVPFAGAVFSHGASFLWGSFLATIAVIVVTKILGDDTEDILVPFQATSTCIASPNPIVVPQGATLPATIPIPPFDPTPIFIDLEGDIGDPSPYWLGVLIAVGTFLFVFFGESKFFILGSCIVYNFYLATWYTATQQPLRPIPDSDDFFRFTRTILIGVAVTLAAFLIPLPKLLPTFIPQPRFASSVIFFQLSQVSKVLVQNFDDIILLFQDMHSHNDKSQMYAFMQARFILIQKILDEQTLLLRKLLKILKLSAQYEPLWFPLPFPHITTVNRIKETIHAYQALIVFEGAMLRSIQHYARNSDENAEISENMNELLRDFSEDVHKLADFHVLGNPLFCNYNDLRSQFQDHSNNFKKMAGDYFKEKGDHPADANSKKSRLLSMGFHTYFFWCMYGVSETVMKIDALRKLPKNRAKGILMAFLDWPLHLLGWFVEYIMIFVKFCKEIVEMVQCRKGASPIHFIEKHYSRFFGSLIIALAGVLAFLFVLVDDWRTRLPTGTTVIIMAIVTIDRDQPNGGFRNAILRLAGTTLGVASAFLIVIFFDDTPEDGLADDPIIISMMIFCLVGRMVMQNPKYMFFAYTFIVTNIILFFAISVDLNTFIGFSGLRAVAIGIGISISAFCMLLWPVRASVRLSRRVSEVVGICRDISLDGLNGKQNAKQLRHISNKLLTLTFKQEIMKDNAEFEPDIFSRPFPSQEYQFIVRAEKRLIHDSLIIGELLLLLHNDKSPRSNEYSDMIGGFKEQLDTSFQILMKRCKIAFSDPFTPQLQVYNLQQEFLQSLPDIPQLLGMENPLDIITSCALMFSFYTLMEDLRLFNTAVTNLVAHRVATSGASIPLRIPARK